MKSKEMAQATRRQSRRRNSSIWPFTILLVLSHGVWNTLQCSTSPSSRTPVIINVSREEPSRFSSSTADYGDERPGEPAFGPGYLEGGTREQLPDRFPRPNRSDIDEHGDERSENEAFHYCQNRLTYELNKICAGKYHVPSDTRRNSLSQKQGQSRKRSLGNAGGTQMVMRRRVPRSLVDECCKKSCTTSYVQRYCQNGNGTAPNSDVNNENKERPAEVPAGEDTVSSSQLNTSGEPESALYYPLLHLLKFIHGRMVTPKQPSPSSVAEQEERGLPPLHQAYVQDKHSAHSAHAFPSTHSNFPRRMQLHSDNSLYQNSNNLLTDASNIGGGGYRGPNVGPLSSGYSNPAYASHVRPSSIFASNFGSRNNHIPYPLRGFQEQGPVQSSEKSIQNGTGKNAVTSTLPPQLISFGTRTDDNIYPLDFLSLNSKEIP